jgi:superfamily I DNA/RNA helicase
MQERVKWLIENGVTPKRICCLTFTNAAANEILKRLGLTKESPHDSCPRVGTIHSLALSAIRRNPTGFGLQDKITPIDDYQQSQLIKKIIERAFPDADPKQLNPYAILDKVGFHRARGLGFRVDYTDEVNEHALIEHAGFHAMDEDELTVWSMYEVSKKNSSVVDFDDMLHLFVRRGEQDEKWRNALQKQYDHVLQDEAQDASVVQWKVINLLLGPTNFNLYSTGDLSQSIMSFNGSCPQLLVEFSKGWKGVVPKMYKVTKNHRSLPRVIKLANAVQAKMVDTIPFQMEYFRGSDTEQGITRIIPGEYPKDVADTFARMIHRDKHDIPYRGNAILVRTAMQIRDIESALVRYRIPYIVRGGKGLLATEEVRDILSYLHFATNPKDFTSFTRALSAPRRGYGDVAQERVREIAEERFNGDLLATIAPDEKLAQFSTLIKSVQGMQDSPVDAVMRIITGSGYKQHIESKYKKDKEKVVTKLDNLERFGELIANLVSDTTMTTEDIVFQLTLDRGREDDKDGMVVISTIHAAKGLEWNRVFLTNAVEGSLPHKFSQSDESEIAEERRCAYVAFTRARDTLLIGVHKLELDQWVDKKCKPRPVEPSRFLKELNII